MLFKNGIKKMYEIKIKNNKNIISIVKNKLKKT